MNELVPFPRTELAIPERKLSPASVVVRARLAPARVRTWPLLLKVVLLSVAVAGVLIGAALLLMGGL